MNTHSNLVINSNGTLSRVEPGHGASLIEALLASIASLFELALLQDVEHIGL